LPRAADRGNLPHRFVAALLRIVSWHPLQARRHRKL
jgi:hypothetical protein